MFFPRLRRHAKWMFVFLAVALGGGFVIFGVGAGGTVCSTVGDCEALVWKSPGSSLAYVQPVESTHAAATTATSRFLAATPQVYDRPFCRTRGIS